MATRLTATAGSADDARAAVEALSLRGVEARRIHVVNPAHDGQGRPTSDDRATDARVLRRLGRRFLTGVLVGGLTGAVLGAIVLALVTGTSSAVFFGALGGATAGGGLGAVIGLQSTPSMATAWEDANAPGPGVRHVIVDEVRDAEREDLRDVLGRHARDVRFSDA